MTTLTPVRGLGLDVWFQWSDVVPILRVILFILMLTSMGCLNETKPTTSSSSNLINPSIFDGAISATNKGGPIEISWSPVSSSAVKEFRIYRLEGAGELKAIGTVGPSSSIFLDGDTSSGQLYSYIVRAIDKNDKEDSNNKVVSSLSYQGITGALTTGRDKVLIQFPSGLGAVDEIRIYAEPVSGGSKTIVGTVSPNQDNLEVSGLRSGTRYKFYVNAYSNSLNAEDGNENSIEAQTLSFSFSGNDFQFRNVVKVKAFGDAPGAPRDISEPTRIPRDRFIELTWLPFLNAQVTTKYKLVRTLRGGSIDMSTTTSCTQTVDDSCVVCEVSGATAMTCTDSAIKDSPAQYDYVVSLTKTDGDQEYTEELPEDLDEQRPFRITVAVPPKNMVLVDRSSANYEICSLLGQSPDPKNNQRCSYSGIGAKPINSSPGKPALNLPQGFYDFGYNLFVDRFGSACNWTKGNGKCGTTWGCAGNDWPSDATGDNGDVFFVTRIDSSTRYTTCAIKKNNKWISIRNEIPGSGTADGLDRLLIEDYQAMLTNDPENTDTSSGHRPPVMGFTQKQAWTLCQSQIDPNYGYKRLPRLREQRVYSAWPWTEGEPDRLTPAQSKPIEDVWDNGHKPGHYGCNQYRLGMNANLSYGDPGFYNSPTSIADLFQPNNYSANAYSNPADYNTSITSYGRHIFFNGSLMTSHCVSRYGVQDHTGNLLDFLSDNFDSCDSGTRSCIGGASGVDSGNQDLDGIRFDGTQGPGGAGYSRDNGRYDGTTTGFPVAYFNIPLGLPFHVASDGATPVNNLKLHPLGNFFHDDWVDMRFTESNPNQPKVRMVLAGGRYDHHSGGGRLRLDFARTDYSSVATTRCVLPVD